MLCGTVYPIYYPPFNHYIKTDKKLNFLYFVRDHKILITKSRCTIVAKYYALDSPFSFKPIFVYVAIVIRMLALLVVLIFMAIVKSFNSIGFKGGEKINVLLYAWSIVTSGGIALTTKIFTFLLQTFFKKFTTKIRQLTTYYYCIGIYSYKRLFFWEGNANFAETWQNLSNSTKLLLAAATSS